MSNHLSRPVVTAASNNKEVSLEQSLGILDACLTEAITVSAAAGNIVLTAAQVQQASFIIIADVTVAGRTVTLPAIRRTMFYRASPTNTQDVTFQLGAGSFAAVPGGLYFVRTNGVDISNYAHVNGGGTVGEAPVDGKQYARKDANWSEVVASSGGAGGVVSYSKPYMGCSARKSAAQTAANYTVLTTLAFDAENIDTHNFHDNAVNNSRVTVAAGLGITKVRIRYVIEVTAITDGDWVFARVLKNGVTVAGLDGTVSADGTAARFTMLSHPISVVDGDYFELQLQVSADTSITVGAGTNLEIEVIERTSDANLTLNSYTVATLPAATIPAQIIYVSDGASNKRLAVSDGTNWRWPDGAIVS